MDWLMQAVSQVCVRDWLTQAGRAVTFNICLFAVGLLSLVDCPLLALPLPDAHS